MALSLSKKDVIPSITSAVFFCWMALWAVTIILRWVTIALTNLFFFLLPIPWILLMIIVWKNWKNITVKILSPEYGKVHFDPLYIREGLVRLYLIMLIFFVFIHYIFLELNGIVLEIPAGLLVVVNAILAYFGFRTTEVLPKDYVIESLNVDVPTNRKLLTSLPLVKDALNEFEVRFKEGLETIDKLLETSALKVEEVVSMLDSRLEDLKKVSNNMPFSSFSRDPFDRYNYLLLVVLLAIINIIAQPVFNIPAYIALPTFSIFGILIGISARNKINGGISNDILQDVSDMNHELERFKEELISAREFTSEQRTELQQLYEAFLTSNFLEFLPSNYSSLLSIGFVSFLSLFIFILPIPIPDTIFTTMQWFIIYYFTTKQ